MPTTVYSETNDVWVGNTDTTYADGRNASTGNVIDSGHDDTSSAFAILYSYSSGRGGGTYYYRRCYFEFDLSSLSGTVTAATFYVYADMLDSGNSNDNVRLCASAAIPTTAGGSTDDNDCFGKVDLTTVHSDAWAISTTEGYHSVAINTPGLTAINSAVGSGDYTVCLLPDGDYANTAPTDATQVKVWFADYTGTSRDPYVSLTFATGYGNKVIDIAAASISKVNGIATATISKVIDV
jgi:hypothetical protein